VRSWRKHSFKVNVHKGEEADVVEELQRQFYLSDTTVGGSPRNQVTRLTIVVVKRFGFQIVMIVSHPKEIAFNVRILQILPIVERKRSSLLETKVFQCLS